MKKKRGSRRSSDSVWELTGFVQGLRTRCVVGSLVEFISSGVIFVWFGRPIGLDLAAFFFYEAHLFGLGTEMGNIS